MSNSLNFNPDGNITANPGGGTLTLFSQAFTGTTGNTNVVGSQDPNITISTTAGSITARDDKVQLTFAADATKKVAFSVNASQSGSTTTTHTLPSATGTLVNTSVKLSVFAATSSSELAGVISDETGSGLLVFATSPTLTTPLLGTPTSGVLTNCTGLPIGSGVSGLATGVATFLATPSSSNLKAAVTDETGSGALVFATSPALTTPDLGTPTALVLTSATGLPLTTGVTGRLPYANIAQASARAVQANATNSTADVASLQSSATGQMINSTASAISWTATPTLGNAGTTVGTLSLQNATSGTLTITPPTGAMGSITQTLQATTDTFVYRATTDTLTNKTLTSPTLTTPVLGTPSSGTLTSCTGLPISTGVSGLGTGVATFLATPSSANLASAITDETGTAGSVVFSASPTLTGTLTAATTSFSGHMTIEGVTSTGATGTGKFVFDGTPTLVTPVLGVATATSINKVAITAPATSATLTIANGKTLTASNTITFTATDGVTVPIGTWTQQRLPATGTYNTPANCKAIRIRAWGGGGQGGGGSATVANEATAGVAGGDTSFNTSTVIAKGGGGGGGGGGNGYSGNGAMGGSSGIAGTGDVTFKGFPGSFSQSISGLAGPGAQGGGQGGGAGGGLGGAGTAGAIPGGGGGGGGAAAVASCAGGAGGGSGGYSEAIILAPSASYGFIIGGAGTGGGAGGTTGGTGGAGGVGGAGYIIVDEFYN